MMSQFPMYETGNCEIYLEYENYLEELDEILLYEWTWKHFPKCTFWIIVGLAK